MIDYTELRKLQIQREEIQTTGDLQALKIIDDQIEDLVNEQHSNTQPINARDYMPHWLEKKRGQALAHNDYATAEVYNDLIGFERGAI
ncbi:MAG: hypothetical protein KGV56_00400 [Gammaproteobacteria bacterium]|nr:hypothetical protein [Gammaproteobacteria bacterium]